MKPIDPKEVMSLADYEAVREHFRGRVIGEKKRRRVALGPKATALFENRDTVLLQIQEMLRTERITRPASVMHEIETYNETIPADDELSCTVMIAIPDTAERDAFLHAAVGFEDKVSLVVGGTSVPARPIARPGDLTDRTTAVHYLKFKLPPELAQSLRSGSTQAPAIALQVDHPVYTVSAPLAPATVEDLREDLRS
ncbi:MAG TPA: DUF3501 family protein [Polyangiaceae bacterium]|jgi:hypothetical protein|nr:DUF3501 family protein [Polyangiaceae bacterium]